jgi:hypothetical protein
LPGILTPNHQSNAKNAATAMVMHKTLNRIRLDTHEQITKELDNQKRISRGFRGAYTSRVLVAVSHRNNLFLCNAMASG